jgi:hypothetical protein
MSKSILGIKPINFNDEQGKAVTLTELYFMWEENHVKGAAAGSVITPIDCSSIEVGDVVDFDYNVNPVTKKAKLIGIKKA